MRPQGRYCLLRHLLSPVAVGRVVVVVVVENDAENGDDVMWSRMAQLLLVSADP